MKSNHQDLAESIIVKAQKEGAEKADIVLIQSADTTLTIRNGKKESVERSESTSLGLRVLIGKKQAIVSSSNLQEQKIIELVKQAVAMAKCAPEDPYTDIANQSDYSKEHIDIESLDQTEPTTEWLYEQVHTMEEAALKTEGIKNSEGADAAHGRNTVTLATTNGFNQSYHNSRTSLSLSVIAGEGTAMERDYDYSTVCFVEDLEKPEILGKSAASKAVRRLSPQKVKTGTYPVIVDPEIAKRIIASLASAVNGAAIARGSSFLKNDMGSQIFSEKITITDNPHIKRGLASKPFDAEGITGQSLDIIKNGVLSSWLLDLRSAAQLKLTTTGRATRRTNSTPSPAPTNMLVQPGTKSPQELISSVNKGIYITDTFGMGVNTVTGDYSQGAAGFIIEDGKISYPVSEFTIASTLQEIFKNFEVANDLKLKSAISCPTAYLGEMTIAGNAT